MPELYYGIEVYGPCLTVKNMHILQKVQNACVSFLIPVRNYRYHITPYRLDLSWQSVQEGVRCTRFEHSWQR